jgi:ABC-type amino acid transport system permease subunit
MSKLTSDREPINAVLGILVNQQGLSMPDPRLQHTWSLVYNRFGFGIVAVMRFHTFCDPWRMRTNVNSLENGKVSMLTIPLDLSINLI